MCWFVVVGSVGCPFLIASKVVFLGICRFWISQFLYFSLSSSFFQFIGIHVHQFPMCL